MFGQSLLSAFGSAACTTDTDQLFTTDVQTTSVATYQLNNATTSIPSNTYPGTPSNITYTAGKFGNAAVFNGSSSYIYLGNSAFQYTSLTISAWIYPTAASSGIILENYESGGSPQNSGWVFRFNSDGTILFGGYGSGAYGLFTTSAVSLNTWTNVTVTFSPTSSAIYFNGVAQSTSSSGWSSPYGTLQYSTGGNNNGNPTNIGRQSYTGGSTNYFTGRIDQVRVFNSVLQQAAVTALYNETTTTATYSYVEYEGANPNSIAYYKMSDATDQFGNYNGTATNVNFNTEGKFGFAGAFNGSSSYITIPQGSLPVGSSSRTVSLWIKTTQTSLAELFGYGVDGTNLYYAININASAGKIGTAFYANDHNFSASVVDGVWHHIVSTYNGNTVTMYVDGNSVGSATAGAINTGSGGTPKIGKYNYTGSIDQIRIYDSALSAANVTTLYNEIECPAVAVTNAFNTVLYTGNGSTQAVTGVGFKPDFTWIKIRTLGYNHYLIDSVRGATEILQSNLTDAESTQSTSLTSFDTNGFTVGSKLNVNANTEDFVSWNWKAGGTAVSNTDGTITSQVSANVDAGFSILKYTGNGNTAQQSYGHGLSSAPELLITKNIDTATQGTNSWVVGGTLLGNGGYMFLNATNAKSTASSYNGNKVPDSEVIYTSGTSDLVGNQNGINFITYCFTSIPGYSKIGSYTGTGASGNFIYTGFQTSYVMTKNIDDGAAFDRWYIQDSVRGGGKILYADESLAEGNYTSVQFDSNGFTLNTTDTGINESGKNYIFLAIA